MDTNDLFISCKRGDITRVQHLVEEQEIELNIRDRWDSTPLYYACLCGHKDLVKYLLDNGAKCEANTFDGERCIYGALNNEIRNMLKSYKVVSSQTRRRQYFDEFMRRILERGAYEDVIYVVRGEVFTAHRCILSARSEYFLKMFNTKWKDRKEIHITHHMVLPGAFKAILSYIYTGQLQCSFDDLEDIMRLAKQCHMEGLMMRLEDKVKQVLSFESSKPGVNVTQISLESAEITEELKVELGKLADETLPSEFTIATSELPFPDTEKMYNHADICFSVEGLHFKCHKVFFCQRSDYFKALLIDHFGETSISQEDLQIVRLTEVTAETFAQIMYYLYQDSCQLTEDTVYDVMCAADMYLLPGLIRQCGDFIGRCLSVESVVNYIQLARLFNQPRLEDQCVEYMAQVIERMVTREDFINLVQEDAESVEQREDTDSIPVIDDIRFHITNYVQTFSAMEEANEKLNLIDDLLEQLGLDG